MGVFGEATHLVLFVQQGAVLQQEVDYHPASEAAGDVERSATFLHGGGFTLNCFVKAKCKLLKLTFKCKINRTSVRNI